MTLAERTINELTAQGWIISHKASYHFSGYVPAGNIGFMKSKNNYDYIRVFDSKCYFIKKRGYYMRLQMTIVLKRVKGEHN